MYIYIYVYTILINTDIVICGIVICIIIIIIIIISSSSSMMIIINLVADEWGHHYWGLCSRSNEFRQIAKDTSS